MRYFVLLLLLIAVGAHANDLIVLTDEESRMAGSEAPLMNRRLGRVMLDVKASCITCGDHGLSIETSLVESLLRGEYLNELKRQLRTNGLLDQQNEKRMALQVNVLKMSHDVTSGASAQRKNPLTHGGSMITSVTMEYVLSDGDQEALRMPLATQGTSNSVSPKDSVIESISIALKKNIRVFLLASKAALEPSFSAVAEPQIKAIMAENVSTRSIMGSFALGLGKFGMGVADVAGSTLKVMASPEFAEGLNASLKEQARTNQQFEQMREQAVINARPQYVASSTTINSTRSTPATNSNGPNASTGVKQTAISSTATQSGESAKRAVTPTPMPPKYQAQVATIGSVSDKCPPGSSPARQANGQYVTIPPTAYCIKDPQNAATQATSQGAKNGSGSGSGSGSGVTNVVNSGASPANNTNPKSGNSSTENTVSKVKKIEWSSVMYETAAVCRRNQHNAEKWWCDGPFQDIILADDTLKDALGLSGCKFPVSATSGTTNKGKTVDIYRCGYGLRKGYDRDIVTKYGITFAPRAYMCPKNQFKECTDFYDGQDKL